jgi:glycerol-3-phosphate O-acyltransferase
METLTTVFKDHIKQVAGLSKSSTAITEENVYQEADANIRPYLDEMVKTLTLGGSGLDGLENLEKLYEKAEEGKSCLLLPEHYSNLDLSLFTYLLEKAGGRGEEISKSVIAIAGMKLNEASPVVSAFASAYTRIVICPSRSFLSLDAVKDREEIIRGNAINRAAMKALVNIKNKGRLILIFPSGTRYRPGDPSTKRGVREIDSYIKSFDYMCLVAITGQVLHIRTESMMDDGVSNDVVRVSAGPVLSCSEFRDKARAGDDKADKKQAVADAIMAELEKMHIEAEEKRKKLLR